MFQKPKPRKNNDEKGRREDESEKESVRSRSDSPAGAGSKPTTKKGKKNKKKMERDSSPTVDYQSYDDVLRAEAERVLQNLKAISDRGGAERVRSDAERVMETADEAAASSERPCLMKSPAGKRRREDTPEKLSDEDKLQEVSQITERLLALLTREKSVSKLLIEDVRQHCTMYERLLQKQLIENARLEGKVAALIEVNNKVDVACTAVHAAVEKLGSAQASSVAGHRSPATDKVSKKTYALVVKGEKKDLTAAEVLQKLGKSSKSIEKEDVKIRKVRYLQSGKGVVVVTENAEDRAKVARVLNDSKGLKASEPKELDPRVIVYDVEKKTKDEDLLKGIARVIGETEPQKVLSKVRPVKRISEDEDSCNVIFDAAPDACKALLKEGRIFCGWQSYKVAQWEEVLRCFRCLEFGHVQKNCKEEQRCWSCCGSGHLAKDCKKNIKSCINCKKKGDRADHSATSRDCPAYKWQLQMLRARTRRD